VFNFLKIRPYFNVFFFSIRLSLIRNSELSGKKHEFNMNHSSCTHSIQMWRELITAIYSAFQSGCEKHAEAEMQQRDSTSRRRCWTHPSRTGGTCRQMTDWPTTVRPAARLSPAFVNDYLLFLSSHMKAPQTIRSTTLALSTPQLAGGRCSPACSCRSRRTGPQGCRFAALLLPNDLADQLWLITDSSFSTPEFATTSTQHNVFLLIFRRLFYLNPESSL